MQTTTAITRQHRTKRTKNTKKNKHLILFIIKFEILKCNLTEGATEHGKLTYVRVQTFFRNVSTILPGAAFKLSTVFENFIMEKFSFNV